MSIAADVTLEPGEVARELDALPTASVVRLGIAGLEAGVLTRAGANHDVQDVRLAVRQLVDAGHTVVLSARLVD